MFEPLGRDSGDGVVLLGRAAGDSGEARGHSSFHRLENGVVNGLVEASGFLCEKGKQSSEQCVTTGAES